MPVGEIGPVCRGESRFGACLTMEPIRVVIDSTFPLAEARRAHERAAKGHIQGKLVLTVEHIMHYLDYRRRARRRLPPERRT